MSQGPLIMPSQAGWTTTAPTYSSNVGRTSALSAARLTELADGVSSITPTSYILDNGAGTGAVTFSLASRHPGTEILATDISADMLENISAARLPNVSTEVMDTRSLGEKLHHGSFTHVFNTFMLQTITTPLAALEEMHTVLGEGGVTGIALWAQRNGPFEIWERACQSIQPSYTLPSPFDDPHAWRTEAELEKAFKETGFEGIRTEEVTMPFPFEGTQKFLDFWFGAKNPAAEKVMSNWTGHMDDAKVAVERVCREEFGDGKDILTWAVLGVGKKI